jgi:pyruvate kinase
MYIELDKPDQIIDGCQQIIQADPDAVLASRIFESLKDLDKMPKSQDMFDVYAGMLMGYKRFLIGDDICMREETVRSAIGLFDVIANKFEKYNKKPIK